MSIDWPANIDHEGKPDFVFGQWSVDVKTRPGIKWSDLIVREADPQPNTIYVQMLGAFPTFRASGWIWGKDVASRGLWHDPNGYGSAWFVSIDRLNQLNLPQWRESIARELSA